MQRRTLTLTVAALAVFAAACGGPSPNGAAATSAAPTQTGAPPVDQFASELSTKPEVTIPGGKPPKQLETEDIVVGTGAKATKTSSVAVHYVGVSWSTGKEFDSSWGGEPVPFSLLRVVPGFQEGIAGMKVGGRRRIVMPPEMGYADNPPPGSGIKPGETLVFVVDLHAVQ